MTLIEFLFCYWLFCAVVSYRVATRVDLVSFINNINDIPEKYISVVVFVSKCLVILLGFYFVPSWIGVTISDLKNR